MILGVSVKLRRTNHRTTGFGNRTQCLEYDHCSTRIKSTRGFVQTHNTRIRDEFDTNRDSLSLLDGESSRYLCWSAKHEFRISLRSNVKYNDVCE